MTTPQDKARKADRELALRIACEGGIKDSFEFAHRYHTAKLEQYGKSVQSVWEAFCGDDVVEITDYERDLIQAAFASREPEIQALRERIAVMDGAGQEQAAEIQALREEVERLKEERDTAQMFAESEDEVLKQQLIAAQLSERKLREAAEDVCATLEHPTNSVNAIQMWKLREALSTPTNTDEADKLIKALEVAKEALEFISTEKVKNLGSARIVASEALAAIREAWITA